MEQFLYFVGLVGVVVTVFFGLLAVMKFMMERTKF